jgi:hypothetical protein
MLQRSKRRRTTARECRLSIDHIIFSRLQRRAAFRPSRRTRCACERHLRPPWITAKSYAAGLGFAPPPARDVNGARERGVNGATETDCNTKAMRAAPVSKVKLRSSRFPQPASRSSRQPAGSLTQRSMSDSRQPAPWMLIRSWAGKVPSAILR